MKIFISWAAAFAGGMHLAGILGAPLWSGGLLGGSIVLSIYFCIIALREAGA